MSYQFVVNMIHIDLSSKFDFYVRTSLGPVVNILTIFSNANILKKNKRIKIYHNKVIGCSLLISINHF